MSHEKTVYLATLHYDRSITNIAIFDSEEAAREAVEYDTTPSLGMELKVTPITYHLSIGKI